MRFVITFIMLVLLTGCSNDGVYYAEEMYVTEEIVEVEENYDLFSVSYGNTDLINIVSDEMNVAFTNPIQDNYVFTSSYGQRWGRMHNGVDLAVLEGTAIFASTSGYVKNVSISDSGYGICIDIECVVANGDIWLTRYAHLSEIVDLQIGDYVKAGEIIALSGNTGDSTGPHLHFEIQRNGVAQNPEFYIDFRK